MASAILFVVIASCFLIMLYRLMSHWFLELLVVIFCIGGVEVHTISFSFLALCLTGSFVFKKLKCPNECITIFFENMVSVLGEH
jgi:hypothetical protein